ncbi:hypothetical protein [Paenibacillus zanthoxyli]|uniref:hypothetical protein n=1 Tax=Paenibacillus zanthoxyli TaxID=369399 RepID=UPI0004723B14|nr:hypothetical protein [Paenibacillus zanthoxyli]
MKKFVSGIIVGALLFGGVSAFAEDIKSLVGLKVQAETTVSVDGQTLTGIIVDGKTYASVRAIGESVGYTVTIDGKKVNLKVGDSVLTTNSFRGYTKEQLQKELDTTKSLLSSYNEALGSIKSSIDSGKYDGEELQYLNDKYKQLTDRITKAEQSIQDIQAKLAEL